MYVGSHYEATNEINLVDDAPPENATLGGSNESWSWNSVSGRVSGDKTHPSANVAGMHQHYFYNSTRQIPLASGDVLYAWVWLNPNALPNEVMLQWYEAGSWEHRAYWGANVLTWGTDNTNSRRYKGALPATGQWVKLEVTADEVGLVGKTINGMAFALNNGQAYWDRAGVRKASMMATKYYHFGGQRIAMRDGTGLYYLHGDHLGSASTTTNANGAKVGEMRFTPFGEVRAMPSQYQNDRRFTGHKSEVTVGLVDMQARMYDPLIGKFVSPDTVVPNFARPQSLNRYAYVENRPLNLVDPTGHCGVTPDGYQVCPTGGTLSVGPVVGEWHAPMSLPEPYTVKVMGNEYQTAVGSTAYQIDQVAYALIPTTLGVTLGGGVSGGQTPVVVQASSNIAGACNWRSAECGGFSGYQVSAGPGVAEGASGNLDAGIFATWGNSDLGGVAGPNNIVTINGKVVPGVGGNGTVTLGQSVDEKTRTPAIDKVSGNRINSVGISAGPSFGANVEASVQVSPAYIPRVPIPLNNTVKMK